MIILLSFYLIECCFSFNSEACEAFSDQSSSICINCKPGYKRDRNHICISSGFLDSNFMHRIENCISYSSDLSCAECINGYMLSKNRCHPLCKPGCSCFAPFECLEKTSHSIKKPCSIENCETCCNDSLGCCKCSPGYGHALGQCMKCKDQSCMSCDSDPEKCTIFAHKLEFDSRYLTTSNNCMDDNCINCPTSADVCTNCASGYAVSSGNCNAVCSDLNCLSCSTPGPYGCTSCKSGFTFNNDNQCASCPRNCQYCTGNYCMACQSGYEFDSNNNCQGSSSESYFLEFIILLVICFVSILISMYDLFRLLFFKLIKVNKKLRENVDLHYQEGDRKNICKNGEPGTPEIINENNPLALSPDENRAGLRVGVINPAGNPAENIGRIRCSN